MLSPRPSRTRHGGEVRVAFPRPFRWVYPPLLASLEAAHRARIQWGRDRPGDEQADPPPRECGHCRRRDGRCPVRLEPPPIWGLTKALLKARDSNFQVEIIRVMSGLGEEYRTHITLATSQLWQLSINHKSQEISGRSVKASVGEEI